MNDRESLLKAVAECAPERFKAMHFAGTVIFQGFEVIFDTHPLLSFEQEDFKNAAACFLMLDEMFARDFYGFGPPVVVELTGGSPAEWYCRRVVCPDSDAPFTTHEEKGASKAEAIARAFVACFAKESAEEK